MTAVEPRWRAKGVKGYWDSLKGSLCPVCRSTCVLHHILAPCPGKVGRRDDWFVVPICPIHHNIGTKSVHLLGSEAAFFREHGVDLVALSIRNLQRWLKNEGAEEGVASAPSG